MPKIRSNPWRSAVLPGSVRSIVVGFGCVLVLATATVDAAGTRDKARPRGRPQSTKIQYEPPASAQSRDILTAFREGRVLESFAAELDGMLRLPRALTLRARECEEPNAYYNPDTASIELCYNLLPAIAQDLATVGMAGERLEEAVTHVFSFFLLHELGHALIDILDLAVPARQEDVADQLSVYAMIEDGDEDGVLAALDGAAWFGIRSHRTDAASAFWDSHSLDAQRYYNINCWVYGSNPEALAHVPEDSGLPLSRAVDCPRDYQNLKRFWDRALEKFLVQPRR